MRFPLGGEMPLEECLSEEIFLSVDAALACVLEHAACGPTEPVPLEAALGRVLAVEVRATRDQPPYDVSAMDGFALRSADLERLPALLTIGEDIKAGDQPRLRVLPGHCARIMTGAPVPEGADAVLRVEDTAPTGDGRVECRKGVIAGNDIRRRGEGMLTGQQLLAPGTRITPGVVGILATAKCAQVEVYRRPRVAILATGDELEALDAPLDPLKIPDSNSYALLAQVQALGCEAQRLGIARDDPEDLARLLRRGLDDGDYNALLVSGGSSVGVHDHVRPVLASLGVSMHFWRVAMRPGHPLAFGTGPRGQLVFGLPGNPVSSMVCCEAFVLPALRRMMGQERLHQRTLPARLTAAVKIRPGRTEFVRVTLSHDADGRLLATPTGTQSSGVLLSMARADALLVVPAALSGHAAGDTVCVQLIEGGQLQTEWGLET